MCRCWQHPPWRWDSCSTGAPCCALLPCSALSVYVCWLLSLRAPRPGSVLALEQPLDWILGFCTGLSISFLFLRALALSWGKRQQSPAVFEQGGGGPARQRGYKTRGHPAQPCCTAGWVLPSILLSCKDVSFAQVEQPCLLLSCPMLSQGCSFGESNVAVAGETGLS